MVVNIAKNIITLSAINDAFSVSFSPSTCVIKADYDGNNPLLNSAYTDVSLKRGEKKAKYELTYKTSSNSGIAYKISTIDEYTKRILLTAIPNNVVSGYLIFDIESDEGYNSTITFQFSVIRESTMLDWIQDWENNKTTIGSTYLITPKIFVGKKVINEAGLNSLTGVYIGPDAASAGIYGYKEGEDIFHINENGGNIGGWEIDTKGIQSSDRLFKILSEGTIKVEDNSGEIIWAIQKGGDATFSKGKVRLNGDGSAYFEGNITSISGNIGGWSLGENLLRSDYLVLDSSRHYIGISPFDLSTLEEIDNAFNHKSYVKEKGGVCMFYTSANSYGIEGYLPVITSDEIRQVFSLGSTNQISGWNMSEKKLASTHVVLVSDDIASGIYMSTTDIGQTSPSNLVGAIEKNSGIYLYSTEHEAKLVGKKDNKTVFSLSSINDSIIAGWKFNEDAIFKGTLVNSGFTKSSGDITISSQGIRGHKWRLDADGNGAIADGEIYWDMDGVHFGENVKLSWNNFSDEAKEDMQDGLLPDWVNDWDKIENKTEISGGYIVSPKIFSGTNTGTADSPILTGIALGREIVNVNGRSRTGLFGIKNNLLTFELDADTGEAVFRGKVEAGTPNGKRIEIDPFISEINIFNEQGALSSTIEGNKYTDINTLLGGVAPTIGTINVPINTTYNLDYSTKKHDDSRKITPIFYSSGNVTMSFSFYASLRFQTDGFFDYNLTIALRLYTYKNQDRTGSINTKIIYVLLNDNKQDISSGDTINFALSDGYHEIELLTSVYGHTNRKSDTAIATIIFRDVKGTAVLENYVSKYYANGLILGTSTENLFSIQNTENDTINLTQCNPNCGLRFDDYKVQVKREGRWGNIPSLICCGYVKKVNKELHSYSSAFDGYHVTVERISTGYYKMTLPDSWVTSGITPSSCYVMLQGIGWAQEAGASEPVDRASPIKATLWKWDADPVNRKYIYIVTSDDSTPNDGDFFFEIKQY